MGLLDDAIREHLDLKRRRGADPAEIERAAQEALGPVRRNRDPASALAADDLREYDKTAIGSARDEPDEGVAADLVDEGPVVVGPPATAEDLLYEDDLVTDEHAVTREPPLDDDPFADLDPEPATRIMRTEDVAAPGDHTAEFDVEEVIAAEEATDDEDVLEETPEFLQDTPDHDRLWFEQRPPRDFDFDG